MKPKKQERKPIDDIFRLRLEQMLDQHHALYRLGRKIGWSLAEQRFGGLYSEKGRPGVSIRLMVDLHYLKYAFNEVLLQRLKRVDCKIETTTNFIQWLSYF